MAAPSIAAWRADPMSEIVRRSNGIEGWHDRAILRRRIEPVAGEGDDAEARGCAAERIGEHAAMLRRQVESYLRHQGSTFVDRFDANSYLYITRAMDYFDLAIEHGGSLPNAFKGTHSRFCIISLTSDWLFPTSESRAVIQALNAAAANVSFVEIESDKGHDAFLLEEPEFFAVMRGFLEGCAEHRGLR